MSIVYDEKFIKSAEELIKKDFNLKFLKFVEQRFEDLYFDGLEMGLNGDEIHFKLKPQTKRLFTRRRNGDDWVIVNGYIFSDEM